MGGKPGTTILLVDPDPGLLVPSLKGVAAVITSPGVTVALNVLENSRPVLVILEYRLPDGSGLDLVAHIRLKYGRVPVVMATGAGSEAVCATAFRLGVADYLIKPIAPARLVETVQRLLLTIAPKNEDKALAADASLAEQTLTDRYTCIRQAARIIETQFDEPISLERLARAVGMERFALSRNFSRLIGKSIRTHLAECRIEKAKELLLTTRHSVTEIAQLVGFSDLPRFDKVFGKLTGMTPSAYRKRRA